MEINEDNKVNNVTDQNNANKVARSNDSENNFGVFSFISFLISIGFMGMGFYKIFAYQNYDEEFEFLAEDNVNSYVGGDAYNYIINANYATGYFTLATLFVILGCTFLIVKEMRKHTR